MIPDYAILDPEMIRHLPPAIVAATGVDALAHAVECYTSLKATPLSDLYAREGARLIFHNIVKAYRDPEDMDAKKAMLLAAYYRQRDNGRSRVVLSTGRKVSYCPRHFQCHSV